jgi:AcrR family transcriptional regulator
MTLEHVEPDTRPLRADAERNRQRILAAAAEVFARRGLEAGLDEIARHAGVGTGTVYRRFPDKTMLIEALFESRIDALIETAGAALEHEDAWEGLVGFLTSSIEMQQADRGLKELLFGEGGVGEALAARFAGKFDALFPAIDLMVERAQASGQLRPDVTASDLAAAQVMAIGVAGFAGPEHPDQWRRQFALLLDGLRAGHASAPLPQSPLSRAELQEICTPPSLRGLRGLRGLRQR